MKMSLAARFKIYNDMLNKDFSGYFMESNEYFFHHIDLHGKY